jgi:hypothetical protein
MAVVSGATGISVSLLPVALRFQLSDVAKTLGSAEGVAPSGGGRGAIPSEGTGSRISGSAQACVAVPNRTTMLIAAMAAIRTNIVFAFQYPDLEDVVPGVAVTTSQWQLLRLIDSGCAVVGDDDV